MKMMYNGIPINSAKVNHYEMNTNDCTMVPSDLQAGVTAVARGQKITGTGKSFSFATYGNYESNIIIPIPSSINVVEIASLHYPIQSLIPFSYMKTIDFSVEQVIGNVIIDGASYPLIVNAKNNLFKISCSKTISLQIFYGKDEYA